MSNQMYPLCISFMIFSHLVLEDSGVEDIFCSIDLDLVWNLPEIKLGCGELQAEPKNG